MQLNPEKVKEGRFLASLKLEQRILADGVLPNSPAEDRFSLVKGILTGLLEKGRWEEALGLVYGNTPVRALFDGDWSSFRQQAIEAIQRGKEDYVSSATIKALIEKKETELLYHLALGRSQGRVRIDHNDSIYSVLHQNDLPRYRQLQIHHAEKELQEGNLLGAAQHFEDAGEKARALELYEKILENPQENWDKAFQAAYKFENRRKRLAGVVQKALSDDQKLKDHRFVQSLHELCKKEYLYLPPEDQAKLEEARVITSATPLEHSTPEQQLLWAKTHVHDSPQTAYLVFKEQKYEGPEILPAVKRGLQQPLREHDNQKLDIRTVTPEHLRAVYAEMPLELQVNIAYHLKDQPELRRLSKTYLEQGNLNRAYQLWVHGDGDLHDWSFRELRARLIEAGLQERYGSSSFSFFLHPTDQEGYQKVVGAILDTRPETAYELAQQSRQEPLIQRTREVLLQRGPERAFDLFQRRNDPEGVTMALQTLAQKYELPLATVEKYVG